MYLKKRTTLLVSYTSTIRTLKGHILQNNVHKQREITFCVSQARSLWVQQGYVRSFNTKFSASETVHQIFCLHFINNILMGLKES